MPPPHMQVAESKITDNKMILIIVFILLIQDSLHAAQLIAQERAAAAAAAKKKGLKSSLGRIFGKKDKGMKSRTGGFVTAPLSVSQHSHYGETEMVQSDSMAGIGGLAGKGDFDRRKKKK